MKKVVEIDYEKYRTLLDLGILAIREHKEMTAEFTDHDRYISELKKVLSGGWWTVKIELALTEGCPEMWNYFTLVDSDEDE